MTLQGPLKTDCPDGCGKFGTPTKATGHVRGCPCEPCSKGWGQTKPRKRIRQRSAKRESTADDGWAEARAEALDRTGGSCELGTPACPDEAHVGIHVHHAMPRAATRGMVDRHRQEWLRVACEAGHAYAHAHPAEAYERGWLLHSWDA